MSESFRIFQKVKDRSYEIFLIFMIALYSISWSFVSIMRHKIFATHTDMGGYEQIIWNAMHGDFLIGTLHSTVAPFTVFINNNVLATEITPHIFSSLHMNFIVLVFLPIYSLFPFTETLLISQSIILASGAIPVYYISKNEIKNKPLALIISASYLLYPALHGSNIIDYNYLVFAVPFLLSAFYFLRKENFKLYWLFIVLALLVREEVSLFVLFFGIFIFIFQKKLLVGFITSIIGITWFIITIFIVMPEITGVQYFRGYFGSLIPAGYGLEALPGVLITDPYRILNQIFTVDRGLYLIQIFSHTGFLSFLSPTYFIMSLPNLLQNLLADFPSLRLMWGHYQLLIIPGVFISTIFSIKKIVHKSKRKHKMIFLGIFLLFFSILSNMAYSPLPIKDLGLIYSNDQLTWENRYVVWEFANVISFEPYGPHVTFDLYEEEFLIVNKAISMIPENASVSSQDNFVSHLSKRKELYLFPIYYDQVDYVLVMEKAHGFFSLGFVQQEQQDKYISFLKNDNRYEIIFNENHLLLFKRIN